MSPSNFGDTFLFTADTTSSGYAFASSLDRVGILHAMPSGASSSTGFNDLTQNNPTFIVKFSTWAYIASIRRGSAVHIGGLVHQWTTTNLASVGGRRVGLERYVHGVWQTLVSQVSGRNGHVSFGFIQQTVYRYRLTVAESGTAWSAASTPTIR